MRIWRTASGFAGTHSWVRALNNTVAHNEAPQGGGGIQIVNVKNPFLRASVFRNNLITFNTPDAVRFDSDGQADVAYNIMHPGGHPRSRPARRGFPSLGWGRISMAV